MRHTFLASLIGTRWEEDESYNSVIKYTIIYTACMVFFIIMEIITYYIYNMKVTNIYLCMYVM